MGKEKNIVNFDEIIDYLKILNLEEKTEVTFPEENISLDSKSINSVYEKISNIIHTLKKDLSAKEVNLFIDNNFDTDLLNYQKEKRIPFKNSFSFRKNKLVDSSKSSLKKIRTLLELSSKTPDSLLIIDKNYISDFTYTGFSINISHFCAIKLFSTIT